MIFPRKTFPDPLSYFHCLSQVTLSQLGLILQFCVGSRVVFWKQLCIWIREVELNSGSASSLLCLPGQNNQTVCNIVSLLCHGNYNAKLLGWFWKLRETTSAKCLVQFRAPRSFHKYWFGGWKASRFGIMFPSPKFTGWISNPPYLGVWQYLEIRTFLKRGV